MMSVLVVDDDDLVLKSLNRVLKLNGYDVTLAESGKVALEEVDKREFDIVLSDIRMPLMDGLETLDRIDGKAKKRLLMTGYSEAYHSRDLKVPCLLKPFGIDELLNHLKGN